MVRNAQVNVGDMGSIYGLGGSPGEGNGNLLAWKIPWREEPSVLPSISIWGHKRIGHSLVTKPQQQQKHLAEDHLCVYFLWILLIETEVFPPLLLAGKHNL